MYYKKLHIDNLDEIINQSRFILQESGLLSFDGSNLYYPELPELPLLNAFLSESGLDDAVLGVALNITSPESSMPIHVDTGELNWSLNIPILNCENSQVNFYTTSQRPRSFSLPNGVTYLGFEDEAAMNLADTALCKDAMVINVKHPHNVINNSEKYRVMLLIRLNEEFDIDYFDDCFSYD
ncbi:hypothetical protein [Pseudoalteromonas rubra]|uniref:Aspartyl/asparaginy/proline hydroxylase domain-containing protein n=1 Tax=Pseudoalteromonas rubra TaxID=43658 RepID=A0A0F4QJ77_9GAMM|nr:hypothetical protein [Pseudoalteromonas rubra]KJZ06712.1 hypothetical protein TW77_18065 [Pseudoalteromonas rubra]